MDTNGGSANRGSAVQVKSFKKIVEELLDLPDNQTCADCGAPKPKWADVSHGVFLCQLCAAEHRAMGPKVSRIKSCELDSFDDPEIEVGLCCFVPAYRR